MGKNFIRHNKELFYGHKIFLCVYLGDKKQKNIHEISFHLFQNSFKKDIFAEIIGWWQ